MATKPKYEPDPLDLAFPQTSAQAPAAPAAATSGASAAEPDPLDLAFPAKPPSESVQATSDSPEITSGPLGFVNALGEIAGKSIVNVPYAAAHGMQDIYRRVKGTDPNAPDSNFTNMLHVPLSPNAQSGLSALGSAVERYIPDRLPGDPGPGADVNEAATFGKGPLVRSLHAAAPFAADVAAISPMFAGRLRFPEAELSPEATVAGSVERQSQGAMAVPTDISQAHPTLRQAIVDEGKKSGGLLNHDAMNAQLKADQFRDPDTGQPVRLTEGEATGNSPLVSAEHNEPKMESFYNDRANTLSRAYDDMSRDAAPNAIHLKQADRGQKVIDAYHSYDDPIKAEVSANYKALQDAHNGQTMPIDGPTLVKNVDHDIEEGVFGDDAVPDAWNKVRDKLANGEEISFRQFENLRTRLAEVGRTGTDTEKALAGQIRSRLEELPLSGESAQLKGLADKARASAKARFDAIDADPAYKAVMEDPTPRNDPKGSPLADKFIEKYFTGGSAPRANVQRAMEKIGSNPDAAEAITAHTMEKLKKSAGDSLQPKGFNGALNDQNGIGGKFDSLIQDPVLRQKIGDFGETLTKAKSYLQGNTISKAGTAQALKTMGLKGAESWATVHSGGVYPIVKEGAKMAGFIPEKGEALVRRSTRPGAGIGLPQ